MMPFVLQQKTPRNISYNDELFRSNRKKVKAIFIGSAFIIPLMGIIFMLKFDDLVSGLLWGAGLAAFCELFGLALMMNAKKAVNMVRDGEVILGTVTGSKIAGNDGKYSGPQSAGYIFVHVDYKDNIGREYRGMVPFIGAKGEIDLREGDKVPVVYQKEKPETFLLYSESLGISPIGRSKVV